MQYNSHSTSQDLVTLANNLVKQDNTSFPLTEKTQYANIANRLILTEIFNAYGGWKYDDRNNTDFPRATNDLVSGTDNYALPTDTTQLNAVYVDYNGDGTWTKLEPLTLEEINQMEAEPSFNDTNGVPRFYRVLSNSIFLYPASNVTRTDGLMIEYSRDVSTFATTDTTKTPGFDPIFHEAIAVYMALQFAKINLNAERVNDLQNDWVDYLVRIKRHYAKKYKDMFPPKIRSTNPINQYL